MDKRIAWVLIIAFLARLFYFFHDHAIWWDAAVYLSMAKYMASLGSIGLWEPIRPLVWPLLLAFAAFTKIDLVIWGYILTTIFSLGIIYLTYAITKHLYNQRIALLASILLSFNWVFFFFNVRLYTEIPSLFFALFAFYAFLRNKPLTTGILTGLAFLTKFPQGILLVVFLVAPIKKWKSLLTILLAFILTTIPYFVFNYINYGSPIEILFFASEVVKHAGIWIFQQPWHFYFKELFVQNILFIFAIPGLLFAWKRKHYALLSLFALFFLYFTQMPHKEIRFAILFLPYLSILASVGYYKIVKEYKVFILIVLVLFTLNMHYDYGNNNDFFTYFEGKDIEGEVLVTQPLTAYYLDGKATTMYFPWFNSSQAVYWHEYIKEKSPEYVTIDTCEGGFLCPPDDTSCNEESENLLNYLDTTYERVYFKENSYCEYIIYKVTNT